MEGQGMELMAHGAEDRVPAPEVEVPEPVLFRLGARLEELEMENARLKRLVGELLVANQLLREKTGVQGQSSGDSRAAV
jgi:hypothetical protein